MIPELGHKRHCPFHLALSWITLEEARGHFRNTMGRSTWRGEEASCQQSAPTSHPRVLATLEVHPPALVEFSNNYSPSQCFDCNLIRNPELNCSQIPNPQNEEGKQHRRLRHD